MKYLSIIFFGLLLAACSEDKPIPKKKITAPKTQAVKQLSYKVVNEFPHDTMSFTQGLLVHNGQLFESTGSPSNIPFTKSVFGPLDLESGKIDIKAELDRDEYFGEGISILNDKIYQLTYLSQKCFVYDAKSFKQINQITFPNKEGWGLTTDGTHLIMSDGSYFLYFIDPETFVVKKRLPITKNRATVNYLNELEYIDGFIYANIWTDTKIVKIDPKTGFIVAEFDIRDLYNKSLAKYRFSQETNGIAYDSISDRLFVTGKLWPYVFEIKLQ